MEVSNNEKTKLRLGIYQGGFRDGVDRNIKLLEEIVSSNYENVDLFIFSELFICGYCIGKEFWNVAEEYNGPSFQKISSIAKHYRVGIVYGYAEKCDSKLYNSAIFIDKAGNLLLNYRKNHCWGEYEKFFFTNGNKLSPVFEFEGWKIGLLICYEIEFPEPAKCLTINGAEIIVVPTALCGEFNAKVTIVSRSYENSVYVCYVNRVGEELCPDWKENGSSFQTTLKFIGLSVVASPDGRELIRVNDKDFGLYITEISKNDPLVIQNRARNPYHLDRRPELYGDILKK